MYTQFFCRIATFVMMADYIIITHKTRENDEKIYCLIGSSATNSIASGSGSEYELFKACAW